MNKSSLRLLTTLVITLSIHAFGGVACAQSAAEPLDMGPSNFGLQDAVVDEIGWAEILPASSLNTYFVTQVAGTSYRVAPNSAGRVTLSRIPHGARLLGFNIYYFSDNPDIPLEVRYCRDYVDSATGEPKGGECPATFYSPIPPPGPSLGNLLVPPAFQTVLRRDDIDADGTHEAIQHSLQFILGTSMGVHSIRPQWLRQVSPAPATATFNDVPPSDGAFQFIEAMAASGITAGCGTGPPLYCPDSFVTRRQMAVFFAKALGLHWSPF